jgi:hypothetical protein
MLATEGFVFLIGSSDRRLIGFLGFQNAQAGNEPANLAHFPLPLAGRLFRGGLGRGAFGRGCFVCLRFN